MTQRTIDGSTARTMRVAGVGRSMAPGATATSFSQQRQRPSSRRGDEDRERRHRERAIAAWLRSLSR